MKQAIVLLLVLCAGVAAQDTGRVRDNIRLADHFPGATADRQIQAAIDDLPASGGLVDARAYGCSAQTIAAPIRIGGEKAAHQRVSLVVDPCTRFNITVHDGSDVLQLHMGSSIRAEGGLNPPDPASGFTLAETAKVRSILSCYPQTRGVNCRASGITLKGHASAEVSKALLYLPGITDTSSFRDVVIWNFSHTCGLRIENARAVGVGPVTFDTISVNGMGLPGARPVCIYAVPGGGIMGGITFMNATITHPGPGGLAMVTIDGQGNEGVPIRGVNFFSGYTEASHADDIDYYIHDAANVNFYGVNGQGVAHGDFIKIAQSGADWVHGVRIFGVYNAVAANTVHDTARGAVVAGKQLNHWAFDEAAGMQTARTGPTCATAASVGAKCSEDVKWSRPFPDTKYTVTCTGGPAASGVPAVSEAVKHSDHVRISIAALTAAPARFSSVDCIAVHD